jgi:uncharacterized protein (TIGR02466 family)
VTNDERPRPELVVGRGVVVDHVELAFFTPVLEVVFDEHERVNPPLLAAVRTIVESEGLATFQDDGSGSTANLLGRPLPGLAELIEFFEGALDHTLAIANTAFLPAPGVELPSDYAAQAELIELWASVVVPGGHVPAHVHPQASWVGVYYLDVGDGEGAALVLSNPAPAAATTDSTLHAFAPQAIAYGVRDGSLLLFPGYVTHAVRRYAGRRPRVSLAFNFRLRDGGFAEANRRRVPKPFRWPDDDERVP